MTEPEPKRAKRKKGESHKDTVTDLIMRESHLELDEHIDSKDSSPAGLSGKEAFEWMIKPMKSYRFFSEYWDKKMLSIQRESPDYYKELFSVAEFDRILRKNYSKMTKTVKLTQVIDGARHYWDSESIVTPTTVWQAFQEGYTVQWSDPISYHHGLWQRFYPIQEYFGSRVGCNMYLTPEGSQGFPPHYDEIDAFVLQIEGIKHWKVYEPKDLDVALPLEPSGYDMSRKEIGHCVYDGILYPGDMLYMPRGFVHEATTDTGYSMHLTVSVSQLSTWGKLLKQAFNEAIDSAIESDIRFRRTVPHDLHDLGDQVATQSTTNCDEFDHPYYKSKTFLTRKASTKATFDKLIRVVLDNHFTLDGAIDEHAIDYLKSSIPPPSNSELLCASTHKSTTVWNEKTSKPEKTSIISPNSHIGIVRPRCTRFVLNDEYSAKIYHNLHNDMDKSETDEETSHFEVEAPCAQAFSVLYKAYPSFVKVCDLPLPTKQQVPFAEKLFDNGLIRISDTSSNG